MEIAHSLKEKGEISGSFKLKNNIQLRRDFCPLIFFPPPILHISLA